MVSVTNRDTIPWGHTAMEECLLLHTWFLLEPILEVLLIEDAGPKNPPPSRVLMTFPDLIGYCS